MGRREYLLNRGLRGGRRDGRAPVFGDTLLAEEEEEADDDQGDDGNAADDAARDGADGYGRRSVRGRRARG